MKKVVTSFADLSPDEFATNHATYAAGSTLKNKLKNRVKENGTSTVTGENMVKRAGEGGVHVESNTLEVPSGGVGAWTVHRASGSGAVAAGGSGKDPLVQAQDASVADMGAAAAGRKHLERQVERQEMRKRQQRGQPRAATDQTQPPAHAQTQAPLHDTRSSGSHAPDVNAASAGAVLTKIEQADDAAVAPAANATGNGGEEQVHQAQLGDVRGDDDDGGVTVATTDVNGNSDSASAGVLRGELALRRKKARGAGGGGGDAGAESGSVGRQSGATTGTGGGASGTDTEDSVALDAALTRALELKLDYLATAAAPRARAASNWSTGASSLLPSQSAASRLGAAVTVRPQDIGLPAVLDWRTKMDIGPMYSQGSCSGCWAYSTVQVRPSTLNPSAQPLNPLP
jgi:hypothetical protein